MPHPIHNIEIHSNVDTIIINRLTKILREKRMHHATLICGPSALNNASIALHIAYLKLVVSPYTVDYNEQLRSFGTSEFISNHREKALHQQFISLLHPDLYFVSSYYGINSLQKKDNSVGQITIADIRQVVKNLQNTPSVANNRVIIIDSANSMNVNAANALLKILEEPRDNIFFILLSSSTKRILPTILSRCNIIQVNGTSFDDFKHKAKNQGDYTDSEIAYLFKISDGNTDLIIPSTTLEKIRSTLATLLLGQAADGDFTYLKEFMKQNEHGFHIISTITQYIIIDKMKDRLLYNRNSQKDANIAYTENQKYMKKCDLARKLLMATDRQYLDKIYSLSGLLGAH